MQRTRRDYRNEKYDPYPKTVSRSTDWEQTKADLVRGQRS